MIEALRVRREELVGFRSAARAELGVALESRKDPDSHLVGDVSALQLELVRIDDQLQDVNLKIWRLEGRVRRISSRRERCPCCHRVMPAKVPRP